MATIHPYLIFPGNTEEAFNFYKSVFGGEFNGLMRFKDSPEKDKVSPEHADKVIHVAFPIGDTMIMASDPPDKWNGTVQQGNNFHLSYSADTKEDADAKFEALAKGGTVYMPMGNTFWGSYFGMLKDKFGIQWMVNYDEK
jgi:PhnB protein